MGKCIPIHIFFQGEVQTFSEMVQKLCPVLMAVTHGLDTQVYSGLECAPSRFARHRLKADTKERRE